jgi:hypothetical protein
VHTEAVSRGGRRGWGSRRGQRAAHCPGVQRESKAEATPKPEVTVARDDDSPTRGKGKRRPKGTRGAEQGGRITWTGGAGRTRAVREGRGGACGAK